MTCPVALSTLDPARLDPTLPILEMIAWALHACLCETCGMQARPSVSINGEYDGAPLRLVFTAHVEPIGKAN